MKLIAIVAGAVLVAACSGSGSSDTTTTTGTTGFTTSHTSGTSASGGNTSGNTSGNGGTTGTTLDCSTTCVSKATACGAPSSSAQAECAQVCSQNPSQSQLACLSADSCTDLGTNPNPCGIGAGTTGNNTTGTSGTTSTTNSSTTTGSTGSCTQTSPYCDGDSVVTCDNGFPVSTSCSQGCNTATNDCHHDYAECQPGFQDSNGSCPAYCDQQSHAFNGVYFCSSYCGPNGECPSGTACAQEGSINVCNPTCQSTCDCPVPPNYPTCSWQTCTSGVCG